MLDIIVTLFTATIKQIINYDFLSCITINANIAVSSTVTVVSASVCLTRLYEGKILMKKPTEHSTDV